MASTNHNPSASSLSECANPAVSSPEDDRSYPGLGNRIQRRIQRGACSTTIAEHESLFAKWFDSHLLQEHGSVPSRYDQRSSEGSRSGLYFLPVPHGHK